MTPEQERKLNELHTAIVGNEEMGHEGLVTRVKRHEKYIEDDRKFKNKVAGGVAVGTVAATGIWTFIREHVFK
jgi:hypothetical protein